MMTKLMMKHKERWTRWDKSQVRFILVYRLGEPGRNSRRVAYRKALYIMGRTANKPFRKE